LPKHKKNINKEVKENMKKYKSLAEELDKAIRQYETQGGKIEAGYMVDGKEPVFENYLSDGETYAFNRAYCIVDKYKNIYETDIDIPYQYKSLDHDINLKEYGYPLSLVSCPVGSNTPLSELTDEEGIEYYLKYVKEDLMKLKGDINE
jgi:hypothetical protein